MAKTPQPTVPVGFRVTENVKDAYQKAARNAGTSLSVWCVSMLNLAANVKETK